MTEIERIKRISELSETVRKSSNELFNLGFLNKEESTSIADSFINAWEREEEKEEFNNKN